MGVRSCLRGTFPGTSHRYALFPHLLWPLQGGPLFLFRLGTTLTVSNMFQTLF